MITECHQHLLSEFLGNGRFSPWKKPAHDWNALSLLWKPLKFRMALDVAGFVFRLVESIEIILDAPDAKACNAVCMLHAGEIVSSDSLAPSPQMHEMDDSGPFQIVDLEPLVWMKLTSYRLKDQVHLLDMIGIGLIDETWPARFSAELAQLPQRLDKIGRAAIFLDFVLS